MTWTANPPWSPPPARKRPAFILVNDDDLTYTKLRFDADSLSFALANLQRFDDALARAVVWLSLWDMTRDGDLAAEKFIDTTLALLATETESTTFRYALSCMSTTAWHYTAPDRRADVVKHIAKGCGSSSSPLPADPTSSSSSSRRTSATARRATPSSPSTRRGLFDGSLIVAGLEIDNNFTWTIINALSSVKLIDQAGIDAQLAKRDTTENREFALGAHAVRGDAAAKEWYGTRALNNADLTNMQLEAVVCGFGATPRPTWPSRTPPSTTTWSTGCGRTRASTWPRRCLRACTRTTPTRPRWSNSVIGGSPTMRMPTTP